MSGAEGGVGVVFSAVARARPSAVAVRAGEGVLSYGELAERAGSFARGLRSRGVGKGDAVVLALPRGVDLIVAMVGCALRGAVYIPVDPSWPAARVERMVSIARPRVVVGGEVGFAEVSGEGGEVGPAEVGRDDALYVMFTSGSTGEPKGVVVPQRGVMRLVIEPDFMEVGPGSVWLHASATSFDASTLEVWAPLLNGGTVVVVEERVPSMAELAETIRRHGVTDAWLTASVFNAFVDHDAGTLGRLRRLFTGGERLSPAHVRRCLKVNPGLVLINGYGPTENTTFTCCHRIAIEDADDPAGIPIGRPIRGTTAVVVDEELGETSDGALGELLAGGDGVALGYLGDEALTRERFVALAGRDGVWYRTGDLVRRREDGAFEFHGRRDRQEKIRGHRVELAEVEHALRRCDGVLDAVAVAVGERADERFLGAACVVADEHVTAERIRARLVESVPRHIVPDRIVCVDALPVGATGKADRNAVVSMLGSSPSVVQSATAVATEPAGAWAAVREELARLLPGADPLPGDRFVMIGGHSLTALRLSAALEERTGVSLGVADIIASDRLADLAGAIERRPGAQRRDRAAEPAADGPIEATTSQRQMYFESAVDPSGLAYLEHIAFAVEGELDASRIEAAWRAIIARHEVLRTRLEFIGDRLHQVIEPADAVEPVIDIVPFEPGTGHSLEACVADAVDRPVSPSEAPACRATVLTMGGQPGVVVLSFHHAFVDEWSLELIAGELSTLLRGEALGGEATNALPYRVFSAWERDALRPDAIGDAATHLVRLPKTEPIGVAPGPVSAIDLAFDAEEHRAIKAAAQAGGSTVFAFLLTLWGEALCDTLGREAVAVLTPLSLRMTPRLQRVVGCCTAVHAIVVDHEHAGGTGVARTREQIHRVYEGGIAPLTEVLSEARRRVPGQLVSLTEFGFALQQAHGFAPVVPGVQTRAMRLPSPVTRFPLSLVLWSREGRLEGRVEAVAGGAAQRAQHAALTAFTLRVRSAIAKGSGPRPAVAAPSMRSIPVSVEPSPAERDAGAPSDAAVRRAWELTLGVSGATPDSDFFASGGHSLLALRLAARLRDELGLEIPLGPFLQHPTLGWLMAHAREASDGAPAEPAISVDLGTGPRTVLCFPGGYGNPLVFARLADALRRRGRGDLRLRCYDLAGCLAGQDPDAGLRRLLDQAAKDWATTDDIVGLLGYSIGGLLALMADRPGRERTDRQRLWLVDVFPATHFLTLSQRLRRSSLNALRDPLHAPGAFLDGVRMQRSRLHTPEMDDGPGLSRAAIEVLKASLGPARYEPWTGPATVIKSGRRPLWQLNLRADQTNGLQATLAGPTRTATVPFFHYDLMSKAADRIADELLSDIRRVAGGSV